MKTKYYSRISLLLFFLLILYAFIGCFNLRKPEPPSSVVSDWASPTEPSVLMNNFKLSITNLNAENYTRCFSDTLEFIPEPGISRNNQGIFSTWSISNEIDYIKNIKNKTLQTSRNSLNIKSPKEKFITPDSLEYSTVYYLTIYHQLPELPYTYSGSMILIMKKNIFNEWQINSWTDNKTSSLPCWTELKLNFSN